ncbi:prepilin peptidase [Candidatus Roizmanbacteria bacterium]|nr:prepilin peptidase [Candidatus Roizmanbacteria bacterium]
MTTLFLFILGSAVGSFLNVLIDRLPHEESITGRSHCDYCKKKIAWYDLIPIISFFVLRGRARCCNKKLSIQYPSVELLTGIVFAVIFIEFSIFNFQFSRLLILFGIASCLIVIFFSDLKYHLISDYILIALSIFSILYNFQSIPRLPFLIASAIIVSGPIYIIYNLSKERAMGLGDVYLSAIMGFLLGWKYGYIALYIAFVTGAIFGIFLMILNKKKLKSKIAFGPFIVFGLLVMLFFGEKILSLITLLYSR